MLPMRVLDTLLLYLELATLAQCKLGFCAYLAMEMGDSFGNLYFHFKGVFRHYHDQMNCFSCLQIARSFGASDVIVVDVQDEKPQKT